MVKKTGYAALDVMEQHLVNNDFFVADQYSIADIALSSNQHEKHTILGPLNLIITPTKMIDTKHIVFMKSGHFIFVMQLLLFS